MAENTGTSPSKRGPIAKIVPSDVYKRAAVPLAVEQWYNFRDFGCHLGNVGLAELSDCELMVEGIGDDKISDITTNILRKMLIEYTQEQCQLHGIAMRRVASGRLWDQERRLWTQGYTELPVVGGRKILLVPKESVRWRMSLTPHEYYNNFVLEFLQAEHLKVHLTGYLGTA